ncbi:MAG: DUF4399 domain-containing protein [Alphaproteobacteria bacterium]|jgi:hypothetical protein|uniref:DUF4399 domain-containing protein n=1 Tax=Pacificispira sp. TaxID=2888761 RepID=UPI001B1F727D|nr:DUF4399 domain-containing protein [Alphaproteobacteria bacterium]MBO6864012.1 DUF4399 domain-containing protein [Alphaproteobacteria bacterium]MEC9266883.1 DUF4399 domain-containing protein [Pseudomonadota bacterium]
MRLSAIAAAFAAVIFLTGTLMGPGPADASQPPPPGARVFFANLKDGDTVKSPFVVQFGAEGVKVVKAGITLPGTGHHHLLIDRELTDDDKGFSIPADDNHLHFGGAQTEVELSLPPGQYTLQLVFGDGDHVPYDPMLTSERITITVE